MQGLRAALSLAVHRPEIFYHMNDVEGREKTVEKEMIEACPCKAASSSHSNTSFLAINNMQSHFWQSLQRVTVEKRLVKHRKEHSTLMLSSYDSKLTFA